MLAVAVFVDGYASTTAKKGPPPDSRRANAQNSAGKSEWRLLRFPSSRWREAVPIRSDGPVDCLPKFLDSWNIRRAQRTKIETAYLPDLGFRFGA
jgi:hypothetical protein